MVNIELKPFSYQAMVRGDPVITRNGKPVKIAVVYLDDDSCAGHEILGWVEGSARSWNLHGKCNQYESLDLFMDRKSVNKWVNVYKRESISLGSYFEMGGMYNSKEEAQNNIKNTLEYLDTIEITFKV